MTKDLVLVTGAAGFLGRAAVRKFAEEGFPVAGIGNGHLTSSEQAALGLCAWFDSPLSFNSMCHLIDQTGRPPSIVVHAAGGSSVQAALSAPLEDFSRSVASTAGLLEALRVKAPEARLLMISSAAVYGNAYSSPIHEDAACNPISYYGAHKRLAEELCAMASRQWGLQHTTVRFFSLYGTGLKKQIFWDLYARVGSGVEKLSLGGTGEETRDFLHVSDAARLLVHLATLEPDGLPTVVNGGTGHATFIRDAALAVVRACGASTSIEFDGTRRPNDPINLVADVSLLKSLGYQQRMTLDDGLSSYVDWCDELTENSEQRGSRAKRQKAKAPD